MLNAACVTSVQAQSDYPAKPIRVVIGTPVGGGSELMGRYAGQPLTAAWGQPIVIDARPGASGNIAAEHVAKSAPDGYTTAIVAASFLFNPALIKNLPYDTVKDFTPLGLVVDIPAVLVTHPSLPAKNVKELIALAKAKQSGADYTPMRSRRVKDAEGNVSVVQQPKRLKSWFWNADGGKVCVSVRYGNKVIELGKGKTAVETTPAELINTLTLLKNATAAGELDAQMDAASAKVRKDFKGEK